jgi:hypothetical protein
MEHMKQQTAEEAAREKFNRIAWWLGRGFARSFECDAIHPRYMEISCEGIEFIRPEVARRNVRKHLLAESERLRELADSLLLPDALMD